jgi:hypothetical protein
MRFERVDHAPAFAVGLFHFRYDRLIRPVGCSNLFATAAARFFRSASDALACCFSTQSSLSLLQPRRARVIEVTAARRRSLNSGSGPSALARKPRELLVLLAASRSAHSETSSPTVNAECRRDRAFATILKN